MRRLICLCMIVRNESHCIVECVKRYLPSLDALAIVDTGSVDSTVEDIEGICKKNKLHSKVIRKTWVDFSTNRNESLALSHQMIRSYYGIRERGPLSFEEYTSHQDDVWYFAICDADNIIMKGMDCHIYFHNYKNILETTEPPLLKEHMHLTEIARGNTQDDINLISDEYSMTLVNSGTMYMGTQFLRAHLHGGRSWKYICPIHEHVTQVGWFNKANMLVDCSMYSGRHGGRSKSRVKYARDAFMLEEALKEGYVDPDEVPRCTFYLAQSYRDAQKREESFKNYQKRAEMEEGFDQEAYMSLIHLAGDYQELEAVKNKEVSEKTVELVRLDYYMKAHEKCPHRREAIRGIYDYYNPRKQFKMCWRLIKDDILNYPNISPYDLVPSSSDYNFLFNENMALLAYNAKDLTSMKILVERALTDPDIQKPENKNHYDRIVSHRKWYPAETAPNAGSTNQPLHPTNAAAMMKGKSYQQILSSFGK